MLFCIAVLPSLLPVGLGGDFLSLHYTPGGIRCARSSMSVALVGSSSLGVPSSGIGPAMVVKGQAGRDSGWFCMNNQV